MKGVVLAGGLGTRLMPMTSVTNKHLLPIYDRPMIYYPIQTLVRSGIEEILVVTGGDHAGGFLKLLGDGDQLGVRRLYYAYQRGEGGIADALRRAEGFVGGDQVCVILGDNVFSHDLTEHVQRFANGNFGAQVLLTEVADPQRFGVAEIDGDKVINIEEKPATPRSNYAVVGAYFYDNRVFDIIRRIVPSSRGELEITDVNNDYIKRGELTYALVKGWWADAGTPESLFRVSKMIAEGA